MKKKYLLLSISLVVLMLSASHYVNNDWLEKAKNQLVKYTSLYPQEKVYLHTDKPHYAKGETIWFSTYLVESRLNTPNAMSNAVYVELIDPDNNILATRNIKIEEGQGKGEFT
ncbi:MAG: hypothetical protein AAFO07_27985, partial [Bacteroidota bacterium]